MKACISILFLITLIAAHAQTPAPTPSVEVTAADQKVRVENILQSLHYQQGNIVLGDKLATVKVPADFRYLNPADTEKVLSDLWGNPPTGKDQVPPLGLLLPADVSPAAPNSWAVLITYEEDGHIKDDDAAKMDYAKLLEQMKKETAANNEERTKQGYPTIKLVGWAEPPHYDSATKKMYWAKELSFGGSDESTLNYDIRVLGRKGVLSLNCIAGIEQLQDIKAASPKIISMIDFNPGQRYAEFNASTDKMAAYGLAALVVGGVAAKAGLFKVILVGILAAKKFIIVGVIALWGAIRKLFGGKKEA